jgi:hypothetical protein
MDTKLTLKLNKDLIAQIKIYAREQNMSLSKLVESFFSSLLFRQKNTTEINTPLINELSGIIKIPTDNSFSDQYADYLIKKYIHD